MTTENIDKKSKGEGEVVSKARRARTTSTRTEKTSRTSKVTKRVSRKPKGEAKRSVTASSPSLPRLLVKQRGEVASAMMQEFEYSSVMEAPRFLKVVVNIGMSEVLQNARAMESATRDLGLITGQKPVTTRAKKSIAGFKIREGMPIGLRVTIRGRRMYEFMDRLMNTALPRVRDFQGLSRNSFDGRGNYSLGVREYIIFPEIDYNTVDRMRGLQVVIETTAKNDIEGLRFLELAGMPFERNKAVG